MFLVPVGEKCEWKSVLSICQQWKSVKLLSSPNLERWANFAKLCNLPVGPYPVGPYIVKFANSIKIDGGKIGLSFPGSHFVPGCILSELAHSTVNEVNQTQSPFVLSSSNFQTSLHNIYKWHQLGPFSDIEYVPSSSSQNAKTRYIESGHVYSALVLEISAKTCHTECSGTRDSAYLTEIVKHLRRSVARLFLCPSPTFPGTNFNLRFCRRDRKIGHNPIGVQVSSVLKFIGFRSRNWQPGTWLLH